MCFLIDNFISAIEYELKFLTLYYYYKTDFNQKYVILYWLACIIIDTDSIYGERLYVFFNICLLV